MWDSSQMVFQGEDGLAYDAHGRAVGRLVSRNGVLMIARLDLFVQDGELQKSVSLPCDLCGLIGCDCPKPEIVEARDG